MAASEPSPKRARTSASLAVGWFRNDLRVRDNPMLEEVAGRAATQGIPALLVYIVDPRFYDRSDYGRVTDPHHEKSIATRKPVDFSSRKCNGRRARFYVGAIRDLRTSLKALGADLWVFHGRPEAVFADLSAQYGTLDVFCLREPVSPEWTDVEESVAAALRVTGGSLTASWGAMSLYHEADLPFRLQASPESYSALARSLGWEDLWTGLSRVDGATPIRKPVSSPSSWSPPKPTAAPEGALGDELLREDRSVLGKLGFSDSEVDAALASPHGGPERGTSGETAAWARLREWMQQAPQKEQNCAQFYPLGASFGAAGAMYVKDGDVDAFQWKNLSGHHGWTQLSKYMACGCITAREVYHTLEAEKHWALAGVAHRFMWREWHRLNAIKHHRRFYWLQGPGMQNMIWKQGPAAAETAERWKTGRTGIPYIDACMRELNETGWIAYKSRKTVATFLAHDLWIDWRVGAFHFEEMLLDYDVAMNYGNWGFCARVDKDYGGRKWQTGTHESLVETLFTEAMNDPEAAYVKRWVPELRRVPPEKAYAPWAMSPEQMEEAACVIGKDYPEPLISADKLGGSARAASAA